MKDSIIEVLSEGERGTRPSWDEYFMKAAIAAASRSSCYKVNAGGVIVQDNRILGTGYNGASRIKNCLEREGCYKEAATGKAYEEAMNVGLCIGVHAEMNALAYMASSDRRNLTLYNTILPCNSCAKTLISNGISRVVFKRGYDGREFGNVLGMFNEAGIKIAQLDLSLERCMDIDFHHVNTVHDVWNPEERARVSGLLNSLKSK